MSRQKKKFNPGHKLKEVFDAIDERRDSARAKFVARKEGLKGKEKVKEIKKAKRLAASEEQTPRKNRLKQDPALVAEQAKEIMDSNNTK